MLAIIVCSEFRKPSSCANKLHHLEEIEIPTKSPELSVTTGKYGDEFFYQCVEMWSKVGIFDFEHYLACRRDETDRKKLSSF